MNHFFDTEFMEDGTKGLLELISIGIVNSNEEQLYCINSEAPLEKANDWVKENVLPHLPPRTDPVWMTKAQIRQAILDFVPRRSKRATFWGYFCDYDWVMLAWAIMGKMVDLPDHFPMYAKDLRQVQAMFGISSLSDLVPTPENAHDALADAVWNYKVHLKLKEIQKKDFPNIKL